MTKKVEESPWQVERREVQKKLRLIEVAVARAGVADVGELVRLSREELAALPGVGERAVRAVRAALAERGLSLRGDRKPSGSKKKRRPKLQLSEAFKHALQQAQHELHRGGSCLFCGRPGGRPYLLPSGEVRVHDECVGDARRAGKAVAMGKGDEVGPPKQAAPRAESSVEVPPWAIRQGRA